MTLVHTNQYELFCDQCLFVVLTLVHTNQYELFCDQWETKVFLFYFTFTSKRSPTIQATSDTKWQIDYPTGSGEILLDSFADWFGRSHDVTAI